MYDATCAVCSPFFVLMSVIGIFRQLRGKICWQKGCVMALRLTALTLRCLLTISLSCVSAIGQCPPQAPSTVCDSRELKHRLNAKDPAYRSAVHLAQTLSSHGITINCALPSKMANFFVGQKGAALFRTDHGDFEALFAFQPEQFANLAVAERPQENSFHTYEIYGTPTVQTIEGREQFFLKHDTTFFITSDEQLARSLTEIYGEQSRLKP